MILSDVDIRLEMRRGNIKIDEFIEENLNPNSYDVTLGNWFIRCVSDPLCNPVFSSPIYVNDGDDFIVGGTDTVLCVTKEIIGTSVGDTDWKNILGIMYAKSTIQRIGISITNDGGFGDIGFNGRWVMSLEANRKIRLTVGQPIAQICFLYSRSYTKNGYEGQYQVNSIENWNPEMMIPKKYRDKNTTSSFSKCRR